MRWYIIHSRLLLAIHDPASYNNIWTKYVVSFGEMPMILQEDRRSTYTSCSTPDGIPAWLARVCSAIAVSGVLSFGLTRAVQPAAKAGPTLRVICLVGEPNGEYRLQWSHQSVLQRLYRIIRTMDRGKFQGVILTVTPTACCIAMI
jgi:hypothetical protein